MTTSPAPFSTMPAGVMTRWPAAPAAVNRSTACSPISSLNAPTTNSRIEVVSPCAKNGLTRRSVFDAAQLLVSTVPLGRA